MRYHHSPKSAETPVYGRIYICDHPVYFACTLYEMDGAGLAVIQQRYREDTKVTWWGVIDDYLRNELYLHPKFLEYFKKMARKPKNSLYPTVTIRQMMWALKMKPLKREPWETVFDHSPI